MASVKPFDKPIYITRPLLPNLNSVMGRLQDVWKAQWLTNNGYQHQLLEEKLKDYLKVPALSLFTNGTIALIVACQSMRLSGEVITTPFTFPATPHVLAWNGIRPIFCDVDPVTMNIDTEKIELLITPQTTAILAVHVFGTPCNVMKIQQIANRYGLRVVYDCAHAFGSEVDGIGIGNFGDVSMFSFHATKLFHTGEGGALTYRDPNLKPRVDFLKNFGIKNEDEVVMPGINGKMSEIQAALGLAVLECIEEEKKKRRLLREAYEYHLSDIEGISCVEEKQGVKSSCQYFVIRIDENAFGKSRDYVYDKLKEFNVFTRKYFYPLCSEYPCYRQLPSSSPANLPVAHKVVQEALSMPFYGGLYVDDIERICEIVKSLR